MWIISECNQNPENKISANEQLSETLLKQVDGFTMGGPLSVTFSDIYMVTVKMML